MESDDDFYSSSPLEESSPPVQLRKLKRLKKNRVLNEPKVKSVDDLLYLPQVDFAKIVELESSKSRGIEDLSKDSYSQSPSEGFGDEDPRLDPVLDEDRRETRRALDFEETGMDRSEEMDEEMAGTETDEINKNLSTEDRSEAVEEEAMDIQSGKSDKGKIIKGVLEDEFEGEGVDRREGMEEDMMDLNTDKSDKKRTTEGGLNEKNEKKKKKRAESADGTKPKASSSNKRKEEKERKATLQQLHAESQRLLRETRDATFKPIPVMQKPISSILEKIRKRKLEVSIKTTLWNHSVSVAEISDRASREVLTSHMSESISIEGRPADKLAKILEVERVDGLKDVTNDHIHTSYNDASKESGTQSTHEKASSPIAMDEETTPAFRAPLDDTQDLFTDSQTSDSKDELPSDQLNYPTEEVMAPSLLTMNLKFDSAPLDDMSSDEEDNDKENIEPHPYRSEIEQSSPKGDPVKAFVDDEAIEEDDSDNEVFRFKSNEEDDAYEDSEELKDMIATNYEEQPIDNDKRNELHQKWLEQQDAAGTDNLLQKLNYGSKFRDGNLVNEESDDEDEDEEEFNDEGEEDLVRRKHARMNSRKAKELIAQMFPVKDDDEAFLSDEEETEKKIVQRRLLDKVKEKVTLLSPAEDENSREVFGLIKKLNIVSDTKKKSKSSSLFDTMLTGGNSNSSSRSSFLGRSSSHSLPSSRKKGPSTMRSFIFGRDDSNSRSSISATEDSLQTGEKQISKESQPAKCTTTKFSSSQTKLGAERKKKGTSEAANGTSLFEILKRSSTSGPSSLCKQDNNNMVGLTQFAAFKLPKKPLKMEGLRS